MLLFILISLVIVIIIHWTVSSYYLKRRRNIKDKRTWLFAEERKKHFVFADIAIIVSFFCVIVYLANTEQYINFSPYTVTGLLFLLSTSQGIEEWIYHRTEKVYYHRFLSSITFLTLMFTFVIGERLI